MERSPIAKEMKYKGAKTPKGVPGVLDKVSANIMPKDKTGNKGGAKDTKMWKKPGATGISRGRGEASSGEVGPIRKKQKTTGDFGSTPQPEQFSNGSGGRTKFVC